MTVLDNVSLFIALHDPEAALLLLDIRDHPKVRIVATIFFVPRVS